MTDACTIFIGDVDPKMLLTINEQNKGGQWVRKRAVDYWHGRIRYHRAFHATPVADRAHITIGFRFPTNHLRDTGNLYPTAKAIVDALVRFWHILPGDDDRYLIGPDLRRTWPNGPHEVRIDIEEVTT